MYTTEGWLTIMLRMSALWVMASPTQQIAVSHVTSLETLHNFVQ